MSTARLHLAVWLITFAVVAYGDKDVDDRLPNAPWMKIAYAFIRYATILQAGYVALLHPTSSRLSKGYESSALLTLDFDTVPFTASACRVWTAEEAVFMELLALTVEAVLVLRREYL